MPNVRILVMRSSTHAHILPESACSQSTEMAEKQIRKAMKYIGFLNDFADVDWEVVEHNVSQPLKAANFVYAKKWLIDHLRLRGYKVV